MKKLLFFIALFLTFNLFAQEKPFVEKAGDLIQTVVNENHIIGIAAGFSVDAEVKWQAGTGFSDKNNKIFFDTNTVTRIASISKMMTATAILQLVEEGRLNLDASIQTYLPSFPQKMEGEITVQHLLQHSSGIDDYKNIKEQENKNGYETLDDAMAIFKDRNLISVPGETFNYTTYGYVVLGAIIEKVSGLSFEDYLKTNIWDKAKMTHTGVEYFDRNVANQSKLYHKSSKGKIKEEERTNLSDRIPGGGIYSTVSDMLRFGDALMNNILIKESSFSLMTKDSQIKKQGNGYGLGLYLYGKNPKYGFVFGHNGTQTGASTFIMLLPEEKTTIVVLSNTSGAMQTVTDITIKLFDIAHEAKG